MKIQKKGIFNLYNKAKPVFIKFVVNTFKKSKVILSYLKNSWRSNLVIFSIVLIFYYVFGALISYKIDTNLNFKNSQTQGYQTIQIAADLIKRETDEHLFTPNLPFIFPIYISDNMPAFQKGIFKSLQNIVRTVAKQHIQEEKIKKAQELLEYPSNVWLFSKTKDFKIAPSSVTQYRKARRYLLEFNKQVKTNSNVLTKVKSALSQDLADIGIFLEKQIPVCSFLKADDVYYEGLGRLYADYLFLKTYECGECTNVNSALKAIQNVFEFKPLFIQNGALGHAFSSNRLIELAYFALKAHTLLNDETADNI